MNPTPSPERPEPPEFPIMNCKAIRSIPWPLLASHENQAHLNHQQSLKRLAERGGLSPSEALAVIENRPWRSMSPHVASEQLNDIISGYHATRTPLPSVGREEKPWFYAANRDAENWSYAGISREDAIRSGREHFGEDDFFITTGHKSQYGHDDDHDPEDFEYTMDSKELELITATVAPGEASPSDKDAEIKRLREKHEYCLRSSANYRSVHLEYQRRCALEVELATLRSTNHSLLALVDTLAGALERFKGLYPNSPHIQHICDAAIAAVTEFKAKETK